MICSVGPALGPLSWFVLEKLLSTWSVNTGTRSRTASLSLSSMGKQTAARVLSFSFSS